MVWRKILSQCVNFFLNVSTYDPFVLGHEEADNVVLGLVLSVFRSYFSSACAYLATLLKSSHSKEYSIGHKKTTTYYWKSVVNAKKTKCSDFFIYFVLEFSIYILQFDFFWHLPLFAIICWSFFCDQYRRP